MRFSINFLMACIATLSTCELSAAGSSTSSGSSSLPGSTPTKIPPVVYPKPQPPQQQLPPQPYVPPPKPVVPAMEKPFGMPGVVGLVDGKWVGTDYLGHLAKSITVNVEVVKGENTSVNIDTNAIQTKVETLLKDEGFTPHADVTEGPPLPFLHILVIVYAIDKDKFVIFCTTRLFEDIHVVRKDFKPAGYWQGITWENQDISVATADKLDAQVKSSVNTLIKAFIDRYQLYNKPDETLPTHK